MSKLDMLRDSLSPAFLDSQPNLGLTSTHPQFWELYQTALTNVRLQVSFSLKNQPNLPQGSFQNPAVSKTAQR